MKTWTDDEVATLIMWYDAVSNKQLSILLPNKSPLAIYKKAYKMGLRKTAEIEYLNRSEGNKGEKAGNWKGGKKVTARGYRQVLLPSHPRADTNGYVLEHIAVWEQETGISVPMDCCIHHLNGNKLDNRIENLCMMKKSAHTAFHHTGTKRSAETKKKISESRRNKNA